jgi:hypothetical protein
VKAIVSQSSGRRGRRDSERKALMFHVFPQLADGVQADGDILFRRYYDECQYPACSR